LAHLARDPEYVARQRERDRALAERTSILRKAEQPLVQALRAVGEDVTSVWDLVNTSRPYPKAIPVLLAHLKKAYPGRVREGIARALAARESRPIWGELLAAFRAEPSECEPGGDVKWGLGCALSAPATDDVLGDVIDILADPRHGQSRIALIDVLLRSKDPRALRVLHESATDPVLARAVGEAFKVLERRRKRRAARRAKGR
jgi:hypothetical protein